MRLLAGGGHELSLFSPVEAAAPTADSGRRSFPWTTRIGFAKQNHPIRVAISASIDCEVYNGSWRIVQDLLRSPCRKKLLVQDEGPDPPR